uniref:ATP synthase complex subunit 8 n=1 Tax=Neurothemis fulvia TaxID=342749 RepID=A0A7M1I7M9_9ODON|nr:ATP synthase F0 subunit 8 [Neurothemis fulvia]QOQ35072.1 ATP synthase F0 subunit 8 [Neurothemis fulvia]
MPQMAPMMWILLFIFFSLMLMMMATLNYYTYTPKMATIKGMKKINMKKNNWLW